MIEWLIRKFASSPFTLSKLNTAAAERVSGADLRVALPAMLRKGEVAAVKKSWGDRLYYIPGEVLLAYWSRWDHSGLKSADPGAVTLLQAARPGLATDLFRSLTWIAQHGLPLTAKGTVHQKSLHKILEQVELKEEDVAGLNLPYPHQEVYPAHAAVVLDMMLALGLTRKERGSWSLNAHELSVWLSNSLQKMNHELLVEVLLRYVPDDVHLSHFAFRLIAADMEEGQWYSMQEALASLQVQGMLPEAISEGKRTWMRSWLAALSGFGWLDLGQDREGELMFRWSMKPVLDKQELADPGAVELFYIQPDFEIIVPPEVSFQVRWELELCCEIVAMDVMSIYRISRSSIEAATQQGRSVEEVVDFLRMNSAGIPDNVLLSLTQWAKEMGRTLFAEVLLLRCKDEEAARRIAAHPGVKDKLEPIGPLDFIVDPAGVDKVEKVLAELNLTPPKWRGSESQEPRYLRLEPEVGSTEPIRSSRPDSDAQQAWIYNGRGYQFYERDLSIPRREQLFPGMQDIPGVWLRELRTYHASTARRMIEQALQWNTKLMLQVEGRLVEFIPDRLEEEEQWRIHGRLFEAERDSLDAGEPQQEVELSPDQWDGMRILLPEI